MSNSSKIVGAAWFASTAALGQKPAVVTVDNFIRAETDHYLAVNAKNAGGLGRFFHAREPASIDQQAVIRMNRDTLYSFAVLDLAAGAATVTLPDAGQRYMALMVANQDHYVPGVYYDHQPHTLTEKDLGTRYAFIVVRTLGNFSDPKNLQDVHRLQDGIKISQQSAGQLELPDWDETSLKQVREGLLVLAKHASFERAFGSKAEVDPVHHLIGTAAGWGGNPDKDASYPGVNPARDDGKTVHRLKVPAEVPVDAFWSISV